MRRGVWGRWTCPTSGRQGHPEIVAEQGRLGRRRRLQGKPGRGTLAGEKSPILGMIQRGGEVVIQMLDNLQQHTLQPLLTRTIQSGSTVCTDEYNIDARLEPWDYRHFTVNQGQAEYARDDDPDAFCEVHVNTMEGFWSLLRSWHFPRTFTHVLDLL
jgi:transposase